ncbi:hypothetical protein HF771_001393 [Salmonella enterica]|nr:hypothetical protein [Salmonella enterica]ECD9513848.1 hypothetical protein [Salmonella enterica subsp. diarizonae]EAP0947758.1 hypothetical protein [Salmonella enterica]EBH2782749.1 hypothetical protein [Salmonella enterica]EBI5285188.1 hypothetical protein [Salmonella enterica]
MQEDTQNAAEITVEATATPQEDCAIVEAVTDATTATEPTVSNKAAKQPKATKTAKPKRKSPEREEIKLAPNPSVLLSKEGFAMYIGKTVAAVIAMAKEGKAPAIYMADPINPGYAELYFDREEWDEACRDLVASAPPEWHDWRNRLFLFKPKRAKAKTKDETEEKMAA